MTTGSKLSVSAEVDAHTKASRSCASSLILANFGLGFVGNIPDVDPAVIGGAGQVAAVFAQRQRPHLARLDGAASYLTRAAPFPGVCIERPNLDFASEPGAGGVSAISRCAEVVAAELVGV